MSPRSVLLGVNLGVVESYSFEGKSEPAYAESSEDMLSEQGNVRPSGLKLSRRFRPLKGRLFFQILISNRR